jgi:hypothetical protein
LNAHVLVCRLPVVEHFIDFLGLQ